MKLTDISLKINSGETIGIVGKTGAGKSTLFKLLLRQYPNFSGHIKIGHEHLSNIDLQTLRSFIGYVPQDQTRSEEHTSELQSRFDLVCRLLLEKKKKIMKNNCR